MKSVIDYLVDSVRSPREQLSRGQHFVRQSFELTVYCWRQLARHRAEGMAAELTYRTIFALIPVVVLGLVMFRIVGGLDDVQEEVENQLYSFFGVPDIPDEYASPALEPAAIVTEIPSGDRDTLQNDSNFPATPNSENSGNLASETDELSETDETSNAADTGDLDRSDATIAGDEVGSGDDLSTPPATVQGEPIVDVEQTLNEPEAEAIDQEVDAAEQSRAEARASIRRTLQTVTAKVSSLDFKSIGVFGLLLFIYAAVALADSVEHLFNRIYEAPSQRPIHLRLAIHWSIITLGSGLLALSLYMSAQVVDWFVSIGAGNTSRYVLGHTLSVTASWVLLFLLYALMPNTNVSIRAAGLGAAIGSVLWEAAKFGFQIYVAKAVPYSAIYGSIGLIPLFLFWIYVTWLIVLFGLTLTYTLQTLRGRPLRDRDRDETATPEGDPDWMLPIMCEVTHEFEAGRTIDEPELADRLGLTSRVVREMTNKLIEADLLRRVHAGSEDSSLTLARPSGKIGIEEILKLAHRTRPTSRHPAWKMLAGLKAAELHAATGKTLADVWAK